MQRAKRCDCVTSVLWSIYFLGSILSWRKKGRPQNEKSYYRQLVHLYIYLNHFLAQNHYTLFGAQFGPISQAIVKTAKNHKKTLKL